MAAFPPPIPEPYPSSKIDLLAQMPSIPTFNTRKSMTMEEDKSQPPTPDGTGLPANFAQIGPGIYRASYPQAAHFAALQPYKLKTIITFVPNDIPLDYQAFMRTDGIKHYQIHVLANKQHDVFTDDTVVNKIIRLMLEPANLPMLIHCNKGKHRTGCMTACFRKVTGWSTEACIREYEKYSKPKMRELDKDFITRFDATVLRPLALENRFFCEAFSELGHASKDSEHTTYSSYTYMSDDSFLTELQAGDSRESAIGYLTDDSMPGPLGEPELHT